MKLNKEVIKQVEEYRSQGVSVEDTATLCGIGLSSFYGWQQDANAILDDIEDGKIKESALSKTEKLKVEFLEAVKKGEANFKNAHVQNIVKASIKGSWQASAWLLERKFPEEFGRVDRNKIELDNEDKVAIKIVNDVPTNK